MSFFISCNTCKDFKHVDALWVGGKIDLVTPRLELVASGCVMLRNLLQKDLSKLALTYTHTLTYVIRYLTLGFSLNIM